MQSSDQNAPLTALPIYEHQVRQASETDSPTLDETAIRQYFRLSGRSFCQKGIGVLPEVLRSEGQTRNSIDRLEILFVRAQMELLNDSDRQNNDAESYAREEIGECPSAILRNDPPILGKNDPLEIEARPIFSNGDGDDESPCQMPERSRVVFAAVGSAPIPGLDRVSALVKTKTAKHPAAEKSKRRGERRTRTTSSVSG